MYTEEYCGGAEPPEEVMEAMLTPKPYTDTLFVNRSDDPERKGTPVIIALNKKGEASIDKLPVGKYLVYKMQLIPLDQTELVSPVDQCEALQSRMPLFNFEITDETVQVSDTFNLFCSPCEPPRP